MVEIPLEPDPEGFAMVRGDIPRFVSPLDGTVVEGRRQYVEHMQKHGVQPFEKGDEKRQPAAPNRKALREYLWEKVDRVNQGHKAQD
jgi:hypothetical protein